MNLVIQTEQAEDGRWLAEVRPLPGVLAYGATKEQAIHNVQGLALRVLADRIEYDGGVPNVIFFVLASDDSSDHDQDSPAEQFSVGNEVTIVHGTFQGFDGVVIEVDVSRLFTIVEIPVFGSRHPVLLRFGEVAKRDS